MTFPLDPGMSEFLARYAEHVLHPDETVQPVPPEGFQAEEGEHVRVAPAREPADPPAGE
jgi:hypothetical protein